MAEPGIRARWCQQVLGGLEQLPHEQYQRTIDALGPELVARIRDAASLAWLPTDVHLAFMGGLHDSLGPEAFHAFHRKMAASTIETPWLRNLVASGFRLMGRTAMTKLFPRGFPTIVRGYGDIAVTQNEERTETEIVFSNVPVEAAVHPGYQVSMVSSLEGVMDVVGIETGRADMDVSRADEGILIFKMFASYT